MGLSPVPPLKSAQLRLIRLSTGAQLVRTGLVRSAPYIRRLVSQYEVTPTWATRELPILVAALRLIDTPGNHWAGFSDIKEATGFDDEELATGVRALETADPPYVRVGMGGYHGNIDAVSERARRELGSWPTPDNLIEELVAALTRAANTETSDVERGRLRAAAEVIGGMARDIVVGAAAARLGQLG